MIWSNVSPSIGYVIFFTVALTLQNGDTALHIAAALKRSKIAKLLVAARINVHIVNRVRFFSIDILVN